MQTYGNVFGDGEEPGLVLFLPIYTHTHTDTLFPKIWFGCPALSKDVFSVELPVYVRKAHQ